MNILFVDDERFVLDALKRNLGEQTWQIDYALSGHEAIVKIVEGQYDVIVTDMSMPVMKGDRLLEEVRRLRPDVTRIILSGHADQSLEIDDVSLAHRWLDKPCAPEVLIEALEEVEQIRTSNSQLSNL